MGVSLIDSHMSFTPAAEILREREKFTPTPPGSPLALDALAAAKAAIKPVVRPNMQPLIAQAWGVSPRGARRQVLIAAGLDPARWESPIHSFTDSERIAIKAAAAAAVRVFERVLNAV